ncbi:TPA: hypothetical protein U2B92_001211 [Streptococcus suis]|uniref:hypothetical protein n=1 Tax=Streptococcus suis TaxID=1307 RepID=UPI0003F51508|nr:hypothetical protein [Streptococcus suis]MCK4069723.1 crossover junction endodeoxyribonuclease RuvC [Streptococcus suis]NQK13419.1 hypothetical protein [Streptococcus suis]HEM3523226.1 hypothetical protein [Streptococcus suis]HEM3554423.1 hypothetical protein [Streptococcus suis]HEM3557063.1 hypothetical protein [Streptococcus suis]
MSNLTLSLDISTAGTGWAIFRGSDLVQSGVLKHKSKSYFERGRYMASELRAIQSRALQKFDCPFETIIVEKNNVMGPNQQSMMSIGIVTGLILGRLIADQVVFVNVSTWRKHWKFSYKDRSKKSMKAQSVAKAAENFKKAVKDDEADAILIGSYFVEAGIENSQLEKHVVR